MRRTLHFRLGFSSLDSLDMIGQHQVQLLALQRKDGSWPCLLYEGPSMLCEVKKSESPSARCTAGGTTWCGVDIIMKWRSIMINRLPKDQSGNWNYRGSSSVFITAIVNNEKECRDIFSLVVNTWLDVQNNNIDFRDRLCLSPSRINLPPSCVFLSYLFSLTTQARIPCICIL